MNRNVQTSLTAVVDNMNEDGEALIELNDERTINLGPLDESVVGEEVEFILQAGGGVKCLDEKYELKHEKPTRSTNEYIEISQTAVVDRMNEDGEALIESGGETINLGPLDESVVGEEVEFKPRAGGGGKCLDEEYKLEDQELREYKRERLKEYIKDHKKTDNKTGPIDTGGESSETSTSDPDNLNKLLKGDM